MSEPSERDPKAVLDAAREALDAIKDEDIGPETEATLNDIQAAYRAVQKRRDRLVGRSVPVIAQDLPMLRQHMVRFSENEASGGGRFIYAMSQAAADSDAEEDTEAAYERDGSKARSIAAEQANLFRQAELLFVSESLARLLEHGHESMGEAGFEPHDLPADHGVAYLDLDMPLTLHGMGEDLYEHGERLLFAWRNVSESTEAYPRGRVEVTTYLDRERSAYVALVADNDQRWRALPRFLWDDAVSIGYGPVAVDVQHHDKRDSHRDHEWWRVRRGPMFRALCYLLQQRVTTSAEETPTRATRKLVKREGGEPAPIRVVALRGATSGGTGGDSDREYVHQWMVRGHWRKQWYPSIQQNRPLFIAPYVKGPEGAPMIGGEKVYRAVAPPDATS